jgi:hypothetical protein
VKDMSHWTPTLGQAHTANMRNGSGAPRGEAQKMVECMLAASVQHALSRKTGRSGRARVVTRAPLTEPTPAACLGPLCLDPNPTKAAPHVHTIIAAQQHQTTAAVDPPHTCQSQQHDAIALCRRLPAPTHGYLGPADPRTRHTSVSGSSTTQRHCAAANTRTGFDRTHGGQPQ